MYSTAGTNRCVLKVFGQVFRLSSLMPAARQIIERGGGLGAEHEADGVRIPRQLLGQVDRVERGSGLAVDLQRTGRFKQCGPLNDVQRRADILRIG
jgi:hypothetical protein